MKDKRYELISQAWKHQGLEFTPEIPWAPTKSIDKFSESFRV